MGMRSLRRADHNVRLELTPMLDVVFLLLTFFIYSVVMMIQADVLPVRLAAVRGTARAAPPSGRIDAITVDKNGTLFFNREKITWDQLDQRLGELTKQTKAPRVYLAMEAHGATDRGPLLITLIERVQAAGVHDFVIVGQKPAA